MDVVSSPRTFLSLAGVMNIVADLTILLFQCHLGGVVLHLCYIVGA